MSISTSISSQDVTRWVAMCLSAMQATDRDVILEYLNEIYQDDISIQAKSKKKEESDLQESGKESSPILLEDIQTERQFGNRENALFPAAARFQEPTPPSNDMPQLLLSTRGGAEIQRDFLPLFVALMSGSSNSDFKQIVKEITAAIFSKTQYSVKEKRVALLSLFLIVESQQNRQKKEELKGAALSAAQKGSFASVLETIRTHIKESAQVLTLLQKEHPIIQEAVTQTKKVQQPSVQINSTLLTDSELPVFSSSLEEGSRIAEIFAAVTPVVEQVVKMATQILATPLPPLPLAVKKDHSLFNPVWQAACDLIKEAAKYTPQQTARSLSSALKGNVKSESITQNKAAFVTQRRGLAPLSGVISSPPEDRTTTGQMKGGRINPFAFSIQAPRDTFLFHSPEHSSAENYQNRGTLETFIPSSVQQFLSLIDQIIGSGTYSLLAVESRFSRRADILQQLLSTNNIEIEGLWKTMIPEIGRGNDGIQSEIVKEQKQSRSAINKNEELQALEDSEVQKALDSEQQILAV